MTAAPAPARIVVARGDDALALLDDRWDDLLARQPLPNPLLSATWLQALASWQTGLPLVVTADTGDELVAGIALELRRPGGRFGPLLAAWLGPFEQLLSPDLLVDPDRPEAAEAVLAAALDEGHALRLDGTPAGGAAARALAAVAPWREARRIDDRWLVSWPPPRVDYCRSRVARELRWAERHGAHVEVRIAATEVEVTPALVRLFRVHRERWRDRDDEMPRFATTHAHRRWNLRVLRAMAALGRVRIVEVVENGRVVAGEVGLLHGHGGVGHTQAVRRDGTLRAPGHAAMLACLDALAEAGATTIDLALGAAEPGGPKRRLGPIPDPVVVLFAARTAARQRPLQALRRVRLAAGRLQHSRGKR